MHDIEVLLDTRMRMYSGIHKSCSLAVISFTCKYILSRSCSASPLSDSVSQQEEHGCVRIASCSALVPTLTGIMSVAIDFFRGILVQID